jgi:hypothetical protein
VRGPGKSSGAFAFALTFLVLFLSRKKEQQSAQKRNKDQIINPSIVTPAKNEWKHKGAEPKQFPPFRLSNHVAIFIVVRYKIKECTGLKPG